MTDWRQVLEHQNQRLTEINRQLRELERRRHNVTQLRDHALQELLNEEVT
jgi:hypothetical protein